MKKYVVIFLAAAALSLFTVGCPAPGGGGEGGGIDWLIPKTGQDADDHTAAGDDGDLQMGADWPDPRFTDNGDGTVTDNLTGLMWEQSPGTDTISWADALTYANDSTLAGYDDWRLPNYYELATLFHGEETVLYTWLNTNGFSNMQNGAYWSGTYTPIGATPYVAAFLTTTGQDIVSSFDPNNRVNEIAYRARLGRGRIAVLKTVPYTEC